VGVAIRHSVPASESFTPCREPKVEQMEAVLPPLQKDARMGQPCEMLRKLSMTH
jgi:hypothetical protein